MDKLTRGPITRVTWPLALAMDETNTRPTGGGIPSLHSWFADGGDGLLFDFTKTDRFFQENTGPTLADDVGESIGLALDQHAWAWKTLAGIQAEQPAAVAPELNSAQWTFTNVSGAASRTATVLHLESASDRIVAKHNSAASHPVGMMLCIAIRVSGSGVIRLFGVSGNGNTSLLYSITLSGTPTDYVAYFSNPTAGTNFGVGVYGGAATSGASPADATFTSVDIRLVSGNHGVQSSATLKPTRQTSGAKFDGSDDNLLTTYLAGSGANSIVALVTVPASLGTTPIIAGAQGTGRFWIGINSATGRLICGVGAIGSIGGITSDIRGRELVVGLTCDGATFTLFQDDQLNYTAAQSGSPDPAMPIRLGALNAGGSASNFFGGSIKKLMTLRKALTLADYLKIRAAMLAA